MDCYLNVVLFHIESQLMMHDVPGVSVDYAYQEEEGPPIAREILTRSSTQNVISAMTFNTTLPAPGLQQPGKPVEDLLQGPIELNKTHPPMPVMQSIPRYRSGDCLGQFHAARIRGSRCGF